MIEIWTGGCVGELALDFDLDGDMVGVFDLLLGVRDFEASSSSLVSDFLFFFSGLSDFLSDPCTGVAEAVVVGVMVLVSGLSFFSSRLSPCNLGREIVEGG
jgi:hypothetical protein